MSTGIVMSKVSERLALTGTLNVVSVLVQLTAPIAFLLNIVGYTQIVDVPMIMRTALLIAPVGVLLGVVDTVYRKGSPQLASAGLLLANLATLGFGLIVMWIGPPL